MSRTLPEQRLWARFRKQIHGMYMRVENIAAPGTPDVWTARAGWIELKVPRRAARAATPILGPGTLRTEQRAWFRAAAHAGAKAWVVAELDGKACYAAIPAADVEAALTTPGTEARARWGHPTLAELWAAIAKS